MGAAVGKTGQDRQAPAPDGQAPGHAGLHQRTAERLRGMIVRCELPPGLPVSEAKICGTLGVSRTPLREAFKLLAAEGLVELRPNRSPRICPMHATEIAQLFEVVSALEGLAAGLAAARMRTAALTRLAALQVRMERHHAAGETESYFAINQQIHIAIVAGARNPTLAATHAWLMARAERARFAALQAQGRWEESIEEHRAILAALKARESVEAGRLLQAHVARTGKIVVDTLSLRRVA